MLEILLLNQKELKDFDILNVCSNQPLNLKKVINFLKQNKINPIIKKITSKADIIKNKGTIKKY